MVKNRLGYGLMLAAFAIMIFFFGKAFLICIFVGVIVLFFLIHMLLQKDSRHICIDLKFSAGCREGEKIQGILSMKSDYRILAAQWLTVQLEICNQMFGVTECKQLEIALNHHDRQYTFEFPAEWCGVSNIVCQSVHMEDLFHMFRQKLPVFDTVSTTIYPRRCNISVEMAKTTIGTAWDEGRMQNKKGHDPSEVFDIKDYSPGDDLRFVHWKLSGKADHLIMRIPSEPTHYHAILLLDLGLTQDDQVVSKQELNMAVAVGAAIGEQMLRQGATFCVAIPRKGGLDICEVGSTREFQKVMQQWLGTPIATVSGQGLEYFMIQHLEEHFTRLLILSAGHYSKDTAILEKRIGVTVVNTVSEAGAVAMGTQQDAEIIEIPADAVEKETYRIIC